MSEPIRTKAKALTKPDWEVIITIPPHKAYRKFISVHVALFESLWDVVGFKQGEPSVYMIARIEKKSRESHEECSSEIGDWVWDIICRENLKTLRISTGKYFSSEGEHKYDNYVDLDISLVLDHGSKGHIQFIVDKILSFNGGYRFLDDRVEAKTNQLLPPLRGGSSKGGA